MRKDESAAVSAAAALLAVGDETEETVTEQGAEEAAPEGTVEREEQEVVVEEPNDEDEFLFPAWEVQLPDELVEELDAPTDEEIQQELEQEEEYEDLDESGRQLLARARSAERKAEHFERLRIQDARKNWTEEAKKFFPLSAHVVDSIQADSRKSFLKQAKAAHEAVVPYVKEITDTAKATIESEKEKARTEAKAEAAEAWGQVPPKVSQPTEASVTQERLSRNRAKGDLAGTIKDMIFPKKEA